MDRSQIERNLGFLGQKLAEIQIKATISLLGGALMVTQIGNRKSTQDIDVVIATNDRGTYQAVQQAIAQRLPIRTKAQAWSIVNGYIPTNQLRLRSGYTAQAIDRCFPN